MIADGDLAEAQQLGQINWCGVNYILSNFDYTNNSYPSGHPLNGLTQNQRAAAIQGAIWYFVTSPYGQYTGASGQKYQFLTDPPTNPAGNTRIDGYPLRDNSMRIINMVPGCSSPCTIGVNCTAGYSACSEGTCNTSFSFPVRINLTPETSTNCGCQTLIATVYDQNNNPMSNIVVKFLTDHGTLSPSSGTTNSSGQVATVLDMVGSPYTANVEVYAEGKFGTFLYDQAQTKQSLTTLTLLPGSVSVNSTVTCQPEPAIIVTKYISNTSSGPWLDENDAPGLLVPGGGNIWYKFVVTNTGNTVLTLVNLTDDVYTPCVIKTTLVPGESTECVMGPIITPMTGCTFIKNTATVTGVNGSITVTHQDDAYYTPTFVKSGIVFIDRNGNGIYEPGDTGIPDVTVHLCLACPDDQVAPINTLGVTKTDINGNYAFPNVPACQNLTTECYAVGVLNQTDAADDVNEYIYQHYRVVETGRVKWVASKNRSVIRFNLCNNETDNNFGFMQSGTVTGYKRNETSGSGLSGWTITLTNQTVGTPAYSNVTNSTGGFIFTDIPWGTYWLNETLLAGWTQSLLTPNRIIEINGTSNILIEQNFTNRENPKSGNVSGSKYNDLNGNGIKEINDVPIPGVVITLYYQNGTVFGTRTTDANGIYVFDPVPTGIYTLNETVPSGWKQTQPASGNYGIEVNSTSRNFTRAFGNQEIPNLCACPARAYFTWVAKPSPAHTIQFTDGSAGNIVYWLYSYGDGKYGIAKSPSHTYPRAGSFTVKLSAQSCDCSGKKTWTYYQTTVIVP